MRAVCAILYGSPFLSRATLRTRVVYCTEQPGASLRAGLARAAADRAYAHDKAVFLHRHRLDKAEHAVLVGPLSRGHTRPDDRR